MKRVAILQSNYIPWKGYFDLIAAVDEFILFDDMQYTRRDWRNRNKIKTTAGLKWLTIPVEVKGKYFQIIKDTLISDPQWAKNHWDSIRHAYAKAPFFKHFREPFEKLYLSESMPNRLSEINYRFITAICDILEINTKISWSMDYGVIEGKTERLLDLCKKAGGTEYWSGPAAKDYFDSELAKKENVKVVWMDYSGYPEYHQLFGEFEHGVTVLDLIFNVGSDARRYMKF